MSACTVPPLSPVTSKNEKNTNVINVFCYEIEIVVDVKMIMAWIMLETVENR